MPCRQRQHAVDQGVQVRYREGRREGEREQYLLRGGTHRREIAQADGKRLVSDVASRREGAVEVHPVDERVCGEDRQGAAFGLDDRSIIADPDDDTGRRGREHRLDACDEGTLTKVGDRLGGIAHEWLLSSVVNRAGLADDRHFDLTRVL